MNRRAQTVAVFLLWVATLLACTLTTNVVQPPPTTVSRATVPPTAAAQPTAAVAPSATAMAESTLPAGRRATVVDIVDGDTIDVRLEGEVYRLRYIGIDTPERGEPFYGEATEANERLVLGREVILVRDVSETDRFGRLLRYVYLPDGTFVNGELVAQGYAVAATFPPDVAQQETLARLQRQARERGAGLWEGAGVDAARAGAGVVIEFIFYHGLQGRNEPDEYAVIANTGQAAVNLGGWRLNAGAEGQDFVFPEVELLPGQRCRVFTNSVEEEGCAFSFESGQALWRNAGDCGRLFDAGGEQVDELCY